MLVLHPTSASKRSLETSSNTTFLLSATETGPPVRCKSVEENLDRQSEEVGLSHVSQWFKKRLMENVYRQCEGLRPRE